MGFDITVSRYDVGKCPHCGKPIKGDMLDHEDSGGYAWKEWLEKIGYYVPFEDRIPDNDWYGKDMTLTLEQAKDLASFAENANVYHWDYISALVNDAIMYDSYVVINADW